FQTGATEGPARRLASWSDRAPRLTMLGLFLIVFVISAFLNNTPVVVMFIPIFASMARRIGMSASKVMMPLSFVCILAGMTTLIGSSTNLLVADSARRLSDVDLQFFTQSQLGLLLAGVGLVYLLIIGGRLMPAHAPTEAEGTDGRQFIAQIDITADHPLIGAKPVAGMFAELPNVTVRLIERGGKVHRPPYDDIEIARGDSLIIAATRQRLTELISSRPGYLRGALRAQGADPSTEPGESFAVIETVVAPGARIIARSIEQSGIHARTGAIVLGVQRRSRMVRGRLADIRLESGDVLLVMGPAESLQALRELRDLLPLEGSLEDVPDIRRAVAARLIFGGVVVAAASGLVDILVAAVIGAVAMIFTRCLNVRQATRALDLNVYLLIAAAFAMGAALEATGGAEAIAHAVVALTMPLGPLAVMSALFLVVVVLTNLLSNSATAVLFTPIAVNAAAQAGVDPLLFVLTVLFASNCSFVTPIAYQTNLLVMGPGRYQFADFVRAGAPLAIIIWLVFTIAAPMCFDLTPALEP
ncbi:MAG: SLC13 family permease, partial [Maricaulaceae bacterium]